MRRSLIIALAVVAAFDVSCLAIAQAQESAIVTRNVKKQAVKHGAVRGRSQTVVITPPYLTSGTKVSPGETRGANLAAEPRFRVLGRNVGGFDQVNLRSDPYYLPHPQSTIYFDSPLGRKLPHEN